MTAALERVRARIADAGGDPGVVRVVAVTKGFGAEAVRAAVCAGLADVGENYAQELLSKDEAIRASKPRIAGAGEVPAPADGRSPGCDAGGGLRWHFLGAVQRNKVAALAPLVSCWQGVARAVEGEAIARRSPGAVVLVEVDATAVPGRNGCRPAAVPALVAELRSAQLDVRGLMTVAPTDPDGARLAYRAVRALADDLGLRERSMGMSDDLELAVAEGSTMVRVGRALFGNRPARRVIAT
ncbi:MAG: YggS family pyridoxal phosphate enzyme [Acidimicrobiales bacterium]